MKMGFNIMKDAFGKLDQFKQEATAPYNFIPLPNKAVVSSLGKSLGEDTEKWADNYAKFVREEGICSGYIDVTLTTKTPVCINWDGKFFAPKGKPVIPGSSLRGMIKNYLKIISCGTMRAGSDGVNEDFTDRHLYYRDIAGDGILSGYYRRELFDIKDGKNRAGESKAGFLARLSNGNYVIYPAELDPPMEYENPWKDMEMYANRIVSEKDYIDLHTGVMQGKRHYYRLRLKNQEWPQPLTDMKDAIESYTNDKERGKVKGRIGLNLLDADNNQSETEFAQTCPEKLQHLVPCFYLANGCKVVHFGYCKFYRIPYKTSISGHVPEELQHEKLVDFADALFGRKDDFASRVFFEDLSREGIGHSNLKSQHHVLAGPKPTSFQLYLDQTGKPAEDKKDRYHWDSKTNIRGYKLYWHSENVATGVARSSITTELMPMPKDTVFSGRIRFENLSDVELGALLKVLQLGQKGCFKIGAGKPLGMGSVSCSSVLHLIDNQVRYKSLLDGDHWQLGENLSEQEQYIRRFDDYMIKATKEQNIEKKYQHILEVLEIMMSWDKKPSEERQIRYMSIDKKEDPRQPYQNRFILPTPDVVVDKRLPKKKK